MKQLEDNISDIKTICFNGPDGGATFLRVSSDTLFPEDKVEKMYERISRAFPNQSGAAETLIGALQAVRNACKADDRAKQLVEREIESLIKLQAIKDLSSGSNKFQQLMQSVSAPKDGNEQKGKGLG
ncbi:MAG: hypothetical protein WCP46_02240 [Alphaproteobacteria bacterium]|jgi:hypothetical protein